MLYEVITLLGITLAWQLIVWITGVPRFILPGPLAVGETFLNQLPLLSRHALVTGAEILLGLLLGVLLGLP